MQYDVTHFTVLLCGGGHPKSYFSNNNNDSLQRKLEIWLVFCLKSLWTLITYIAFSISMKDQAAEDCCNLLFVPF